MRLRRHWVRPAGRARKGRSGYRREHSNLWPREDNTRAGEEKAQTWQNNTTI